MYNWENIGVFIFILKIFHIIISFVSYYYYYFITGR